MFGLRAVIIVPILVAVILADSDSDEHFFGQDPPGNGHSPCNPNPKKPNNLPPCSPTTKSTTTTTTTEDDTWEEQTTKLNDIEEPLDGVSALETAHWCRFSNGTFVPYNHKFLHTPCTLCRCTKLRSFRCQPLECMVTYCADNSKPYRPEGQCCTRCAADPPSNSCLFNGTTYPHGVILKAIQGRMQCWCQHGTVECRQYIGTLFDGFNLMANGAVIYVMFIVIFMLVFFGLLICCGCTAVIYYYYNQNQQVCQEAYDQYVNSAGWQPMEEETVVDSAAEEKRLEAEQNQYFYDNQGIIPPPYDIHNGSHVSGQEQK